MSPMSESKMMSMVEIDPMSAYMATARMPVGKTSLARLRLAGRSPYGNRRAESLAWDE